MTPFISGKDSLNNEFTWVGEDGVKQSMAIPPSLLISALGQVEDVARCVTMDLKSAGNAIYLVGKTRKEFGGSQLFEALELAGGQVPTVALEEAKQTFVAVHAAIHRGDVRACHDLSEGGLAVALSEMAFAGQLGVEVDLAAASTAANLPSTQLLFSETNSRFLIEVEPERKSQFESGFEGLAVVRIGQVTEGPQVIVRNGEQQLVDLPWSELFQAWHAPLDWA
jgi:phosphoribosylformylglycinamidine synthase